MHLRTAPSFPTYCQISFVVRMYYACPVFPRTTGGSDKSCGHSNPRIVLLTPGPHNETYFEHSYISRYLGFTLVEGADLTVRDAERLPEDCGGLGKGGRNSAQSGRQLLRSA